MSSQLFRASFSAYSQSATRLSRSSRNVAPLTKQLRQAAAQQFIGQARDVCHHVHRQLVRASICAAHTMQAAKVHQTAWFLSEMHCRGSSDHAVSTFEYCIARRNLWTAGASLLRRAPSRRACFLTCSQCIRDQVTGCLLDCSASHTSVSSSVGQTAHTPMQGHTDHFDVAVDWSQLATTACRFYGVLNMLGLYNKEAKILFLVRRWVLLCFAWCVVSIAEPARQQALRHTPALLQQIQATSTQPYAPHCAPASLRLARLRNSG